jgi:hypothetical protein
MNADTLTEIAQVKAGSYTNQYTPILEALWHPFFNSGFGPGWILAGQLLVFAFGAFLVLRLVFSPLGAAVAVALVSLTPPVFGELGLVGRDTWFLALTVACFGCVARAFASSDRRRQAWTWGALLAAWLSLAARQNAAASIFVPLALLAGAWLVSRSPSLAQRQQALAIRSIALGVIGTLVMMGSQLLLQRVALTVHNAHGMAQLYIYDLASLSRQDGRNYFPTSVLADRSMRPINTTSTDYMTPLLFGPQAPIAYPIGAKVEAALKTVWTDRVPADPLGYMRERSALMLDEIGVTNDSIWAYHPVIDPNNFGYHTTFPWANDIATDYEKAFTSTANNGDALFAPWPYLLACVAAAAMLSRSWRRLVLGGLALSALTYQVGLFFGLMGVNYRYEFPAVAIGQITIAVGLRTSWRRTRVWRASRHPPSRGRTLPATPNGE